MKIFITGGTGFIGSHLIPRLLQENYKLTLLVRESSVSKQDINHQVEYFIDSGDTDTLTEHFKTNRYEGIIHLATYFSPEHTASSIAPMINSNILLGTRVLEAGSNGEVKWFLNTGTFWQHYDNAEYSPANLYAATKQAFECIARYYQEAKGIAFCTIKLNDTYGPNDFRPKLLNLWKKQENTANLMAMSPGEQKIDIVHIDDVVNAFLTLVRLLCKSPLQHNSQSYTVSSGTQVKLRELADIYQRARQCSLNLNWGARPYRKREIMVPYHNGHPVPGWTPRIPLEEGLKKI